MFKIKFPTKPISQIFTILKINGMAPFCNLFIERPSYLRRCHNSNGAEPKVDVDDLYHWTASDTHSKRLRFRSPRVPLWPQNVIHLPAKAHAILTTCIHNIYYRT